MLKLEDIIYDGSSIKVSDVTYAALNSNSPFIYLEKSDYDKFVEKLTSVVGDDFECDTYL